MEDGGSSPEERGWQVGSLGIYRFRRGVQGCRVEYIGKDLSGWLLYSYLNLSLLALQASCPTLDVATTCVHVAVGYGFR